MVNNVNTTLLEYLVMLIINILSVPLFCKNEQSTIEFMDKENTNRYHHAWGVTEFAQLYFPEQPPSVAYKRMRRWIIESRGLRQKLLDAGWAPFQKLYTPKQVECLLNHLGEP